LKDFDLIRVIGRGSYAKVLMVELKKTSRVYAMKVIKKALVTDDEVMKMFRDLFQIKGRRDDI
jgi:atypical protein kinase C iota type